MDFLPFNGLFRMYYSKTLTLKKKMAQMFKQNFDMVLIAEIFNI